MVFSRPITPDAEAFLANIRRQGRPERVHFIELFLDAEVQEEIDRRFGLTRGLSADDPFYAEKRQIAIQRFLGYDYVGCSIYPPMVFSHLRTADTAGLARKNGRGFINEHKGPITNWEEYEKYPWPDPAAVSDRALQWYEKNLPDDMCILGLGPGHYAEHLAWLMGYETLCFALYDQPDLVAAITQKSLQIDRVLMARLLQFPRVRCVWGSDDMGFRSGTLISPADTRKYVLAGHKEMAALAHAAGRCYILHSCGNLAQIMPDLLDDVKIDGKHSFEDTIETVTQAKETYGRRMALLGGIDVDFLCRSDESAIRARVRKTLDACMEGGGYCLGTGNSVANYIPVENYLAMLDEGRRYA